MITQFAIFLNSVGPLVWIMQVPFPQISFLVTTRVLRISLPQWIPISHLNSNVVLLSARFLAILFRVRSFCSETTVFQAVDDLESQSINRSIWLPFVRISMERWTLFWCRFAYGPQDCCYGMSTFHFCCMSYALTGWMFCGQLLRWFYWHFFARQSLPWLWYLWFPFTWFRIARISFEGLSAVSGNYLFGCRTQFSCFNSLGDPRTAARTRDFVASMDHPAIGYEIRVAIISRKAVICYQVCLRKSFVFVPYSWASATAEAQSLSH